MGVQHRHPSSVLLVLPSTNIPPPYEWYHYTARINLIPVFGLEARAKQPLRYLLSGRTDAVWYEWNHRSLVRTGPYVSGAEPVARGRIGKRSSEVTEASPRSRSIGLQYRKVSTGNVRSYGTVRRTVLPRVLYWAPCRAYSLGYGNGVCRRSVGGYGNGVNRFVPASEIGAVEVALRLAILPGGIAPVSTGDQLQLRGKF
eukprot:2959570-Rhodomonas_salina.1